MNDKKNLHNWASMNFRRETEKKQHGDTHEKENGEITHLQYFVYIWIGVPDWESENSEIVARASMTSPTTLKISIKSPAKI